MRSKYVYGIRQDEELKFPTLGSADRRGDGGIRFYTAKQLPAALSRHFAGKRNLVLLRAEARKLGDRLRWELSPDDELIPVFHGELAFGDARCVGHLPEGPDGRPFLPDQWRRGGVIASRVVTPDDWMDARGWDEYWSAVLLDRFWTRVQTRTGDFHHVYGPYLQTVEERRGHRILLAGNGMQPDPFGFVHAGFDVTVVDVSSVACNFLASKRLTQERLAQLFLVCDSKPISENFTELIPNAEKSRQRVLDEHRPGGRIAIVREDFFTYEPEQPFHAIFSRRAYQGFSRERREELAHRFFRWLHPGGIALVHMHRIRDREEWEGPFMRAGFRQVKGWEIASSADKRVFFWHSSG